MKIQLAEATMAQPSIVIALTLVIVLANASCEQRLQMEFAIYKDVAFWKGNKLYSRISGGSDNDQQKIPDWRVVLDDGTELYMPEVKESLIKEMIEAKFGETAFAHISRESEALGGKSTRVMYSFTRWNWLQFEDGKLISFNLASGGDPPLSRASVGRGKTGKLYPLNMTKQELRDAFGEPVRFSRGSMHVP
jgi:hypothetical protein